MDQKAMITTILRSSCHWKTLVPFLLAKNRQENAFLTLTVNNHTLKQFMPSKTTINLLFNDMLFSHCFFFDWKIGVLKQTVVRVCYILNQQIHVGVACTNNM